MTGNCGTSFLVFLPTKLFSVTCNYSSKHGGQTDRYCHPPPCEVAKKRDEPSECFLCEKKGLLLNLKVTFNTRKHIFFCRLEVRDLLVANIPDVFNQLLGHKNARRGALKVLDALQDERLNKQLFYDLLEVILKDGFPELSGI